MCPSFSALQRSCSSVLEGTGPPQTEGGTAGCGYSEAATWLLQRKRHKDTGHCEQHGRMGTRRQGRELGMGKG